MRREQLEHAIRTACQIIEHPAVIIVGSQAILGSYREDELPPEATMSIEVDIIPLADTNEETARLADLIEGVAGEWSPFEEQHGFSIDGVDLHTAVFPEGWRDRLVKIQNTNTAPPSGAPQFTGWCLDKEDLLSRSYPPSERRTRTSWQPYSTLASSMPVSLPNACTPFPRTTCRRPSVRTRGLLPEAESRPGCGTPFLHSRLQDAARTSTDGPDDVARDQSGINGRS